MNAHKRKDQDTRLMELASRFRVVASYLDIKYYFHSYLSKSPSSLHAFTPTDSQKILDDALKQGYVLLKNFIALMVGTSGVGKTCLKCLLMGLNPPDARTSTICAEHPIKIRSVSSSQIQKLRGKWKEVSTDKLLPMIGRFIRKNAKKLGVELTPEILELLEAFTTAAVSGKVATSSTASSSSAAMAGESASSLPSTEKGELESSSSQKEAAALEEMIESVLGSLEKVIAGEELTEEEEDELISSIWIYFTDSGGQPQFHELLPLFIHDVSSIILVSRLSDRLDDHPPDEYYRDGQLVGEKSSTHLTTTEQIKCLTSSLLSRSTDQSDVPDIIMVGTHRDKVHECPESIEEKNEKLLKMFGPELEPHLVFYEGVKSLLFPVNTIDPKDLDKEVARRIRVAVEMSKCCKEVKVPIWWFILEILIQGLAKKLGKRVLSWEQCVKIANALGFSERSFNAALKFFNKLNVMKYSSALPEVVFVDSQVPLDNVSDLVQEGYLLRHGKPSSRRGNWKRFCYEGVVTLDFMASTCNHFEKGIFESPQLLKLLQDQLVVVLLEASEYFMPALLDVLSQEELEKHRVFSSPAAPLLFRFPCGCRRAGVFCCLVVYLMKQSKWSIQHINKKLILVARNCVTFRLPKPSCLVTLIDAFYFFEVHIAAKTKASVCQEACPTIRKEILAGIEAASEKLHYSNDHPEVAVFCSCQGVAASLPNSVRHAAIVQEGGEDCACIETSLSTALDERHTVWLGQGMLQSFLLLGFRPMFMRCFFFNFHSTNSAPFFSWSSCYVSVSSW